MENTENKVPQGWRDVQIVPDMPLSALVNFLNVLNQRLCALEDIVTVPGEDGKAISLTDLYALQAEAAMKLQEEASAEMIGE
jgi:hypothetical protein